MRLDLYFSFIFLVFLSIGVGVLSGCVPTLGSRLTGKDHLAKGHYIDLNTVPSHAEATLSKGLHQEEESVAREKDKNTLEERRRDLQAEGEKLRNKLRTRSSSDSTAAIKDVQKNGKKSGS